MGTSTYVSAANGDSNATLLERAAEGDQLSWRHLVEKYDGVVRSVARSFRLQTADVFDVSQTTWLRLVQHLHSIRDPERLVGWLAVTATRESLSIMRKASRHDLQSSIEETSDADPGVDPETAAAARDAARHLWSTVAELPAGQQRLLIALFREESNSYNDVATKCAMPIGSIGPTRARALSRLQRKLAERGLGSADL
jgi:RNA polymerase sigma factor (sigma-70 family)